MVLMMKRRMTLAIFSFLAMMILIQGTPVNAHTPGPMNLTYDFVSQELTIVVTHDVPDVNSHYIIQVNVERNSVDFLTRDYTSQNTTSQMSAIYSIPAVHGDVLEVTAICSVSGSVTNQITVVDPENTDTIPTIGVPPPLVDSTYAQTINFVCEVRHPRTAKLGAVADDPLPTLAQNAELLDLDRRVGKLRILL